MSDANESDLVALGEGAYQTFLTELLALAEAVQNARAAGDHQLAGQLLFGFARLQYSHASGFAKHRYLDLWLAVARRMINTKFEVQAILRSVADALRDAPLLLAQPGSQPNETGDIPAAEPVASQS